VKVIYARNAEDALFTALILFRNEGVEETSRNGRVIVLPYPVTTVYKYPRERVIFSGERDCNPFLHFFESLWMLAGRRDVEFVSQFSKNISQFSDDGVVFNAAYGHRWRSHFGYDQIEWVIDILRKDPSSRRAVISMWDGHRDLMNQGSKDLPCNTQVVFRVIGKTLDMTVFNRSNDAIWGAYGANVVHFSFLQEYVAASLNVDVGAYRQVSNNLHLYPDVRVAARMLALAGASSEQHYAYGRVKTAPFLFYFPEEEKNGFVEELMQFVDNPHRPLSGKSRFFQEVVSPLWNLWGVRGETTGEVVRAARLMADCDWKLAATQWINRRRAAKDLPPINEEECSHVRRTSTAHGEQGSLAQPAIAGKGPGNRVSAQGVLRKACDHPDSGREQEGPGRNARGNEKGV